MNKLLILTSYAKFELNSLRNNEITMTLLIADILAVATKRKSEMKSYLNNGYDVMNYFAKFEKFLPHSIIIPSFMTVGSQMPELDRGAFLPPPPYKLQSWTKLDGTPCHMAEKRLFLPLFNVAVRLSRTLTYMLTYNIDLGDGGRGKVALPN